MEEYWKAIQLYEEDVIPRSGKNELIKNFLAHFSKSAKDSFVKLVNKRLRPPTPDEMDWLIENIQRYHAHYTELEEQRKKEEGYQLPLIS